MAFLILTKPMSLTQVQELAQEWYGFMIKGCVDVAKNRVALGGDYHMETCELLTASGSKHEDVWGFNIRFDSTEKGAIEFNSLVNIKPALGNSGMDLSDLGTIKTCEEIIRKWVIYG